jgi:hypothetical protein
MSENENEHVWFREQIAVALANGLSAQEAVRFEAHAAACEKCAVELAGAREMERTMTAMFAMPSMGLEDRVIARLREPRRSWRPRLAIHPAVARAGAIAASVLLLAGAGVVVTDMLTPLQSGRQDVATTQPVLYGGLGWEKNSLSGVNRDDFYLHGRVSNGSNRYGYASDFDRDNLRRSQSGYWDLGGGQSKVAAGAGEVRFDTSGGVPGATAGKPNTTSYAGAAITPGQADESRVSSRGSEVKVKGTQWFEPTSLGRKVTQLGVELQTLDRGGDVAGKRIEDLSAADGKVLQQQKELPMLVAQAPAEVPGAPAPADAEPKQPADVEPSNRKVIRNGQMEFEVDRYDAAFAQVSKLTTENGGYVGTTDSEKLPNGKVKGTVIVRVPPDRLDTLVLQLRGIGDLKSQKLEAQDISKQYTDLESGLRAAKAMEERLMQMVKEGKGAIKDLLAAEKELGVWRQKVEQITGEMKYYDNLVALSTLKVTLFERDIQTAAKATETETIDAGLEAEDVEKARTDALKAIEEAKGRVIQSDLKRYDAGQFGATIVAEVPPDGSRPLLDRIRQIGNVARLDIRRK